MDYYGDIKTKTRKNAFTGYHDDGGNSYADLPFYQKRDISNRKDLEELAASGLLDEFMKYRKRNTLWENVKSAGAGALDILQRPEYATVAAEKAAAEGENVLGPIARELFSGIGDIKGKKETSGEALRQANPGYAKFAEEHPIASIGTDLAMSLVNDPTTYIPSSIIAKAGKGVIRGTGKAVRAITPEAVKNTLGRTFVPEYLLRKGSQRVTGSEEAGQKAYDTIWQVGNETEALKNKYMQEFAPVIKRLRQAKTGEEALKIAEEASPLWRKIGRRDLRYLNKPLEVKDESGKIVSSLFGNYIPNRPKSYADIAEDVGDYSPTGHARVNTQNPAFTKSKTIRENEGILQFMRDSGVAKENIGEAFARSFETRLRESTNVFNKTRINNRLFREAPEVFRELPLGTRTVWAKGKPELDAVGNVIQEGEHLLKKGETIYMPNGNLRFFQQEALKMNKDVKEMLGKYYDTIAGQGDDIGLFMTGDELYDLVTKFPSITTKVKAYAVPTEVHEALMKLDRAGKDPNGPLAWWDKMVSLFKNTAILSPGFHIRNFISSGAQNYLADVNPARYADTIRIFAGKNAEDMISGKTVGTWKELMKKYGVTKGSFIGQDVGKSNIPGLSPVFDFNRAIGGNIETVHRAALFIDRIKKGENPLEAAKDVKKFHFDYNELTNAEREGFRRAMPFYTWSRKNIPLQAEMLLTAPKKYRNIAKLKEAVAGGQTSENQPEWWKNQDVWETKFQNQRGERTGVSVNLPYSDLNIADRAFQGMLGPAGTLYNMSQNYDPFRQQQISQFPGQRIPVIESEKTKVTLPVASFPQVDYALRNLIPLYNRITGAGSALTQRIQGEPGSTYKLVSKAFLNIMPLVKEKEEKQRIYKLMNELRDFERYREQGEGIYGR